MVPRVVFLEREGVRLRCVDYEGEGAGVLLLHGLAGHAGEWASTVAWLRETHRVVCLDARGHGGSERVPPDVSPIAHRDDAVFVVEELRLAPVILIGQSFGGLTAMLVAAARPDIARSLITVDASPAEDLESVVVGVADALESWPVPFQTRADAIEFFGGPSLAAEAWVAGLEERVDGVSPQFEVPVMRATLQAANSRSYWGEWESICCPTLIVRAGGGVVTRADANQMVSRLPGARFVEIEDAAHDLHLDRPNEWRQIASGFLATV